MKAVLEGLLFMAGDEGLKVEKISKILNIPDEKTILLLEELSNDYSSDNHGIQVKRFGSTFKFVTKEKFVNYYKMLTDETVNEKLSSSALEVLAIVAYNGPVTRVTIDEIRGVSCAHIVRKLVFRNLIKEAGRSDLPGKPILYEVTDQFLDYFGLKSTADLPKIDFVQNNEEVELFNSKYKEEI